MTEETTESKPNILLKRKEDQELRIYFFIGNKPPQMLPTGRPTQGQSKVFYVTSFKLEEAFELAKVKGEGFNLLFTAQNPTVREFLHELELESLAYQALKEKPKAKVKDPLPQPAKEPVRIDLSPEQMSFEKFRAGLLFCANEEKIIYQKPEDKEALKEILSGLSYENGKG